MVAPLVVVIDGPAGAGKSTVARNLAERLSLPLLDTGAIYRTLAWVARERGIAWDDEAALAELCSDFPIRFTPAAPGERQRVDFDDVDVTMAIRTPEISEGASRVSAHPQVRAGLLAIQRQLAQAGCVAEGRDMGTVVFPDADFKFFLTADLATRAERRRAELAGQGQAPSAEQVQADMERRDARDSSREAAPLRRAPDAIEVDSSGASAEAVTEHMLSIILSRVPVRGG
jgi:cytidylate kinase